MGLPAFPYLTAVVGGGSVGLLYAARLADSGISTVVVTRTRLQAEQLEREGITVQQLDGTRLQVPVQARPIEQGLPKADLYLLTVKQTDLPALLPALRSAPGGARFLALQNGMGHQELLAGVLPERQCFFGIHTEGARRLSATEVAHTGTGVLRIGPWRKKAEADPLIDAFAIVAKQAGFQVSQVEEIEPFAWRKLLANSVINPLTAIFDVPNGALLENSHTVSLMRALFEEASAVARSCGQKMEESDWQEIGIICRNTSQNLSSMLQDIKRQRGTEVEAINGYIVKKGKEAGIPTPLHECLFRVVLLKTSVESEKGGDDFT